MKGFVEHLIASSDEMERELSKDYEKNYFFKDKVILCVGIGKNTFPVISLLDSMEARDVVFADLLCETDSIMDNCEIQALCNPEVSGWKIDNRVRLPFISVFMIDFNEGIDIDKVVHFIDETRTAFPYTNIVVMSVIPMDGNRAEAFEKCNRLSVVSDTMFVIDEQHISLKYPDCDGKNNTLHMKSLSFIERQFRDFVEMIFSDANINIDWNDILDFVTKTETEGNKALYFTYSGNNPKEVLDIVKKEISDYNLDNVLVDIVYSDDSFMSYTIKYLKTIASFDFIWGIRKSDSLENSALRINVFAHNKSNQNIYE